MAERRRPGVIRDAIFAVFRDEDRELTIDELWHGVSNRLGEEVPRSSIRSYLNINTPDTFRRSARGQYRMARQ
jgi:hypothetical protein